MTPPVYQDLPLPFEVAAAVASCGSSTYTHCMRARVTLTTDFGTRDPYVAQLKAVLYAQGPESLEVIDLSHEIEPQNLREAALFVRAAWPRFPAGTIHMVVVDPGVGSARRALAVANRAHSMLGPDNGVLSLVFDGTSRAVEIEPSRLGAASISATFHGRDVFAPAAARLAHGAALDMLGPAADQLVRLSLPTPQRQSNRLRGEIIHVDRFGNLITNLSRAELGALQQSAPSRVRLGDGAVLPWVHCYAEAPAGVAVALMGSSELVEIAVRDASARRLTGAAVGDAVWIEAS
jgi:S-adenosylmethionine hydrolase